MTLFSNSVFEDLLRLLLGWTQHCYWKQSALSQAALNKENESLIWPAASKTGYPSETGLQAGHPLPGLETTDNTRSGLCILREKDNTEHGDLKTLSTEDKEETKWRKTHNRDDYVFFFFTSNISIKVVTVHIQRPSISEIAWSGTPCTRVSQE